MQQRIALLEAWAEQPVRPALPRHWDQILAAGFLYHDHRELEINTVAIMLTALELLEASDFYWAFTAFKLADFSINRLDKFEMLLSGQMEQPDTKGYYKYGPPTMGTSQG